MVISGAKTRPWNILCPTDAFVCCPKGPALRRFPPPDPTAGKVSRGEISIRIRYAKRVCPSASQGKSGEKFPGAARPRGFYRKIGIKDSFSAKDFAAWDWLIGLYKPVCIERHVLAAARFD